MKKVTCSSAKHFVCRRCTDVGDNAEEPVEVLCHYTNYTSGDCEGILLLPRQAEC